MQSALKVFIIAVIAVAVALGLYVVVQVDFSMSMSSGGFSPGFAWLMKVRAAENGGQIAPSLDQLGVSGAAPPFLAGGPDALSGVFGGRSAAALDKGLDLGKAPSLLLRDVGLLALAAVLAVLFEVGLKFVRRPRRQAPAES